MALIAEQRAVLNISVPTPRSGRPGPPREKGPAGRHELRIPLPSKRHLTDQVEFNLRLLCRGCLSNELTFRRVEEGRPYCCLFLEGSRYRDICPYLSEDRIHVRSYGCDMRRYGCDKAQS